MNPTIIQTSDAFRYKRMLDATCRTAIEYCRRHGLAYEQYVGVKRGFHGAQAAFNRMFMLLEMYDRGCRDWVLYLDADAYFHDLDFDLRAYLAMHAEKAAIMATIEGEAIEWHINSGVLFFNLGHWVTRPLLDHWLAQFMALDEAQLRKMTSVWDVINDQKMLSDTLGNHPEWREHILFEDPMLINHKDGRFIRQFLSAFESDLDARIRAIELEVSFLLRGTPAARPDDVDAEAMIADCYRTILRRDPDPEGLAAYCRLVESHGPASAIKSISRYMIDSDEYKQLKGF